MEDKIYAAISAVMSDVGAVGKNDVNQFDKYRFRGIDAVMNALSPAMVKNKVFVIPEVLEASREDRQSRKGEPLIYSVVKVKYTFYTDDGSSVVAVVVGEAMDRSDKSTNKAMSAAFKYACFQTFCIPTEEMQDSEKETLEPAPKTPTQTPAEPESESARVAKLMLEMKRTGINLTSLLATYKMTPVTTISDEKNLARLSAEQYQDAMNKFSRMATKAA